MIRCFFKLFMLVLPCFLMVFGTVHASPRHKRSHHVSSRSASLHHSAPAKKKKHSVSVHHQRHHQKLKSVKKKTIKKRSRIHKAPRPTSRVMLSASSSRFTIPTYLKQQNHSPTPTDTQLPDALPSVDLVYQTIDSLSYSHYKLGGDRFDLDRGVFVLDCSSYVDRVLKKSAPFAYQHFARTMQTDRPTTEHYYRFFKQLSDQGRNPFWGKVSSVPELKAGDILVFRYKNSRGRDSGGHVMVVMEKPKKSLDGYLVKVADSAASGHSNDTRLRGISGIGIGTMQLKAHPETGKPLAFGWKIGSWWKRNVDIIMGRPVARERRLNAA